MISSIVKQRDKKNFFCTCDKERHTKLIDDKVQIVN